MLDTWNLYNVKQQFYLNKKEGRKGKRGERGREGETEMEREKDKVYKKNILSQFRNATDKNK